MTQPTTGLGLVEPSPRAASPIARRMAFACTGTSYPGASCADTSCTDTEGTAAACTDSASAVATGPPCLFGHGLRGLSMTTESGNTREPRRKANDVLGRVTDERHTDTARRALPPIRTFTVGPGISPGQPAAGCGRVADCNRRFGITPTPECAATGTGRFCHVRPSAMQATAVRWLTERGPERPGTPSSRRGLSR